MQKSLTVVPNFSIQKKKENGTTNNCQTQKNNVVDDFSIIDQYHVHCLDMDYLGYIDFVLLKQLFLEQVNHS